MSTKFFLNADMGSLAFQKEADVVAYPSGAWIEVASADVPTTVPTSSSIESLSKDVAAYRNGMLRLVCDDEAATWSIQIYEGTISTAPSGAKMAKMYNADISGVGTTVIPVVVFMVKYIWVRVISLSTGNVSIEWAPAEWEEVD